MRIGVLGTGIMGAPMARNLAQAGHAVTVWNRTHAKAQALSGNGVEVAETIAAACRAAALLVVMVSNDETAERVLFGKGGASTALPPGAIVAMMSSIGVDTARSQGARLAERGIGYVDAPVSGGERGAVAGTLAIMAGGDADHVAAIREPLAALGRLTHVGPVGSGQLAKLANQAIVGITIGAVAEALILAEAGGADPAAVRDALLGGFADSTVLRQHGERMIARDFAPGAHATTQLKDLRNAARLAERLGRPLPFTALAHDLYAALCEGELAARDHSALYLHLAGQR
ncbi:NAD(P)-dependent oxidoreductase [Erythrobacter sp. NE805]|uniref:NAD(P)-dependent oxidoreductase n=1 Tax=Erythrobacter sp. NE805 TaxID=3389875 RepID=UPI00396B32F1